MGSHRYPRDMRSPRGVDSVQIMLVIETESVRGTGVSPEQVQRYVKQYWTLDGKLLAEFDPMIDRVVQGLDIGTQGDA